VQGICSAEIVEETNQRIHSYTDKMSLQRRKNIEERQQEIIFNFGEKLLKHYIKTIRYTKPF
jgi:vacuolar-type H+-ATPase subunit H